MGKWTRSAPGTGPLRALLAGALLLAGCGSDDDTDGAPGDVAADAPSDAGADDASVETGGWEVAPPAPPRFRPCPEGWREIPPSGETPALCEPWPETGRAACSAGQMHLPGTPGCAPVGAPCPAGDWADDLPAERTVRYVRAGEPAGGTGSLAAPFATAAEALAVAADGDVIALARGEYPECLALDHSVVLWGACAAETTLACPTPSDTESTVAVEAAAVGLRNLRLSGPRPAVRADGAGRSIDLQGVAVEQAGVKALLLTNGAALTADRLRVFETRPNVGESYGRGLQLETAAQATIRHAVFESNHDAATMLFDPETRLVLEDAAVVGTLPRASDDSVGRGLDVELGAALELRRAAVEANHDLGVFVAENGSTVTLEDVVVRDTQSDHQYLASGRGLEAQRGAAISARRTLLERNREAAIVGAGSGTTLELEDLLVRDTFSRETDRQAGQGLVVQEGAAATLTRARFERNRDVVLLAHGAGTRLDVADLAALDTASQESDGTFGRGMEAAAGASFSAERVLLERCRCDGASAFDPGTVMELTDLVVRETLERECVATTCPDDAGGAGRGVTSREVAQLTLTRFVIRDSALLAVQLSAEGAVDLHQGEIANQPVAINLQVEGYDIDRLQDRVYFVDNDRNLDSTELPVPDTSELP